MYRAIISAAIIGLPVADGIADEIPDPAELEAEGYVIGRVTLDREDVFDLANPDEDRWLYRMANRYHIVTLEKTINKQLLFDPGEPFDHRIVEESERILRANKYIYDAHITPVRAADGKVDLEVSTRDVWSLSPELSYSRKGGVTRTRIGLEEFNLLGRGQRLRFLRDNDVDRTENTVEFADSHLGRSWVSLVARYSDNSDGESELLSVTRPFYALDTRWAAGGSVFAEDRQDKLYQYGEPAAEYRQERDYGMVFGGWSNGLRNGLARRWTVGVVSDDNRFSAPLDSVLPAVIPEDRKLVYPFVGFELLEDEFEKSSNRDQIDRTEDFYLGTHLTARLGVATESLGSDRTALVYGGSYSKGWGSMDDRALLLRSTLGGRVDDGDSVNTLLTVDARYYRQQSKKRLFFVTLDGAWGNDLDLDKLVELGGDTGLRGYPLRYQTGESKTLLTVEQRYFTDWYPFRLVRVGFAAFADIGRTWGINPVNSEQAGWLKDVGFGLRLAPTRSSGREIVHLDVAFPLDGDPSIDSVQILLESKRSF